MIKLGSPLDLDKDICQKIWVSQFANHWKRVDAEMVRPSPGLLEIQHFPGNRAQETIFKNLTNALVTGRGSVVQQDFCIRLTSATLVGERAIIPTATGRVITDSVHQNHGARIFESTERRRFEFVHLDFDGESFDLTLASKDTIHHQDAIALLSSMEQGNYGAFLLRVLPKLATLEYLKIKPSAYFVSVEQPWQTHVLRAFGVPEDAITPYDRTKLHKFHDLIVPSMSSAEFAINEVTATFFREFVSRVTADDDQNIRPKRLYISRQRQARERPHYRVCLNEAALVAKLEDIGFHILEPEGLPFIEQVKAFSAAEMVVGASGAAMFNTAFCRPGTKILSIEPMANWVMLHANMYAGFNHDYNMILGGHDPDDQTPQKRWMADINLILDCIRRILH